MSAGNYNIEGLTIAVSDMQAMLAFYRHVFGIQFEEQEMYGMKLYSGQWECLKLLLCPAELADVKVDQNRHQFDIIVEDVDAMVKKAVSVGGSQFGGEQTTANEKVIAVKDPDDNSIVLKQPL
ncbi:MAG: VOC family protein [Bacteroidota bacterium]